jgi:hypothetical protein
MNLKPRKGKNGSIITPSIIQRIKDMAGKVGLNTLPHFFLTNNP